MKNLALHILDIAHNSIRAKSKLLSITVIDDKVNEKFSILIEDDGEGMDSETIQKVCDPFYTTRTTRKVGLGLSLLKMNAERTEGDFSIWSEPGKGTKVEAIFNSGHWDMPAIGDIPDVVVGLATSIKESDIIYSHQVNTKKYVFDTREVKKELDDIPMYMPEVSRYLKEMVKENIQDLVI